MAKPAAGARAGRPRPEQTQGRPPKARNRVDAWMDQDFKFAGSVIKRKTAAVFLLGIPALAPLFFMSRAVIELNSDTMNQVEADVLGTGSMALLILTLTVTPMATLTGQHWFVPLRKWYGIVLACTATTDAILAAIASSFTGGILGRLTGHTFLLIGFVMVSLLFPLLLISNNRAQRWLGKSSRGSAPSGCSPSTDDQMPTLPGGRRATSGTPRHDVAAPARGPGSGRVAAPLPAE